MGQVISTVLSWFSRKGRSGEVKEATEAKQSYSKPEKNSAILSQNRGSIGASLHACIQSRRIYQTLDSVGSLIDAVNDKDDGRRLCLPEELKDVIASAETSHIEECGLERVGIFMGKEDFIERPVPLAWGKGGEIKSKGPYTSSQKILLVGEGDFSFSTCLARAFGSATNMIATSLDSWEFLTKNYKRAICNILELTSRGCAVMHEIDATMMAKGYTRLHGIQFDRIVFNFPHAGVFKNDGSRKSQLRQHQKLISMFLANAKEMIKEDGEIHIRHKSIGFFRQWKIELLGLNEGLQLVEVVRFYRKEYEGYSTKFGFGGNMNFFCNPSKTYKFGLQPALARKPTAAE